MLEEVRKQNEIAMNATEQVINNGREDLASMTEEVWEGEDGDMARELLDDLLNQKMAQTWREIDAIHEAIKKAQKKAYEAKNFCNKFLQIFRDGTVPSDTDSTPCSGDLMCDKESCEQLKSSMEKAAQSASRVKSKTETLESILAELETPEAKFDYSSYTETIKTQTQNVIDRVAIFNNAVTKYEQKVEELDQTLASELLAATPDAVPTPFDPSILCERESVHMKDGDIVNFLEKYNIVDLGERLTSTQISNILAILFDKKDVNTAELSERDYEVAFLKLPEDKEIAIFMEMGLTRNQIGSIIVELAEEKAGKKGAKGKAPSGLGKILKKAIEKAKDFASDKIEEAEAAKVESMPEWYGNPMQLDGDTEQEQYLNRRLSGEAFSEWDQDKIDELWKACEQIYDAYGIQVDPRLLLAIIIHEGTGSFNTSSENLAGDGQNGPEADYALDLMKANALVFGKILGYMYYHEEYEMAVANCPELNGQGGIFHYMNWKTPIVRLNSGIVEPGVYATHSEWADDVESLYESLTYDGASSDYNDYILSLDKDQIQIIAGDIVFPEYSFVAEQDGNDSEGSKDNTWTVSAE